MDSTNNNPTISPAPSPEPQLGASDQPGSASPSSPASPSTPGIALDPSAAQPISQGPTPTAINSSSVPPVPPVSPVSTPVDTPAGNPVSTPVKPPVSPVNPPIAPTPVTAPVNPIINPGVSLPQNGVGATDAILRPEPVPEPDPVEEELKAPMRAAAPAPGSIGSAVSGPTSDLGNLSDQTPSVSFNDPATEPDLINSSEPTQGKNAKKTNSKTLIVLIIIAAMVVIALGAVLVMQFLLPTLTPSSGSASNVNNAIVNPDQNTNNSSNTSESSTTSSTKLSCTKVTSTEVAEADTEGASSTTKITANFSGDKLVTIASEITTGNNAEGESDMSEELSTVKTSNAADLTAESAASYNLPVDENGEIDLTKSGIQKNYELLDFVCEVL